MDLKTYLSILNRQRIVIIGTLLFAVLAALAGTFLLTPKYKTAATLRFATAINGSTDWVQYNIEYTDRLMNTYSQLATSSTSMSELMRQFQLSSAPDVSVKIIANSELMELWVTHEDPQLVAQMANSLAQFLITEGGQITDSNRKRAQELLLEQIASAEKAISDNQLKMNSLTGDSQTINDQRSALSRTIGAQGVALDQMKKELDQAQIQETLQSTIISVVDPANAPSSPSSPNMLLNLALGIFAGLIGGLGLAFLIENFDTKIRSVEQLQTLSELPILGKIPNSQSSKNRDGEQEMDPAGYTAFRRLSVNILSRSTRDTFSSFLITSAEQQEGRSTIIANLAWALAESGRRVIVLDSDFNAPTIHALFGLPNHIGLSNILQEQEWLVRQRTQANNGAGLDHTAMGNRMTLGNRMAVDSRMADSRMPVAASMPMTANGASYTHSVTPANGTAVTADVAHTAVKDTESVDISSILKKSLEVSVANSIQHTMIPGVEVLSTGPLTLNNPGQLLTRARFNALLEQLRDRCDIVLIDAPAFMSASYTSTIASTVDSIALVVACGQVKQDVVKETLGQLDTVSPNILGMIANWAKPQSR